VTTKTVEDATADIVTPEQIPHSRQRQNDPAPHNVAPEAALPTGQANIHATDDAATAPLRTPVRDEATNPFLDAEPRPGPPEQNPSSPTSTERNFHMATPSTAARTPGPPQVGHHSTAHHCHSPANGPAGHKHRYTASDVWTFFKETEDKNICIFCT
jgi:hypothetical protein